MDRHPWQQCDGEYFKQELPSNIWSIEILSEEDNAHDIRTKGKQSSYEHLPVKFVNRREDVEEFGYNKCAESDSHNIGKALREEDHSPKHDDTALEDWFPYP